MHLSPPPCVRIVLCRYGTELYSRNLSLLAVENMLRIIMSMFYVSVLKILVIDVISLYRLFCLLRITDRLVSTTVTH
jgi:hypothetical protein